MVLVVKCTIDYSSIHFIHLLTCIFFQSWKFYFAEQGSLVDDVVAQILWRASKSNSACVAVRLLFFGWLNYFFFYKQKIQAKHKKMIIFQINFIIQVSKLLINNNKQHEKGWNKASLAKFCFSTCRNQRATWKNISKLTSNNEQLWMSIEYWI